MTSVQLRDRSVCVGEIVCVIYPHILCGLDSHSLTLAVAWPVLVIENLSN